MIVNIYYWRNYHNFLYSCKAITRFILEPKRESLVLLLQRNYLLHARIKDKKSLCYRLISSSFSLVMHKIIISIWGKNRSHKKLFLLVTWLVLTINMLYIHFVHTLCAFFNPLLWLEGIMNMQMRKVFFLTCVSKCGMETSQVVQ